MDPKKNSLKKNNNIASIIPLIYFKSTNLASVVPQNHSLKIHDYGLNDRLEIYFKINDFAFMVLKKILERIHDYGFDGP